MAFYVYILASQRNGTLYTGYTDDLYRRIWKLELIERFNSGWRDLFEDMQ